MTKAELIAAMAGQADDAIVFICKNAGDAVMHSIVNVEIGLVNASDGPNCIILQASEDDLRD
jgi:ApbE superfamily uncharacterized protein (UPF0280 family)